MRAQQALRTGMGLLLDSSCFSMPDSTRIDFTLATTSCAASSARWRCPRSSSAPEDHSMACILQKAVQAYSGTHTL